MVQAEKCAGARVYVCVYIRDKRKNKEYIFVPSAFVVTVTMLSKLNNVRAG